MLLVFLKDMTMNHLKGNKWHIGNISLHQAWRWTPRNKHNGLNEDPKVRPKGKDQDECPRSRPRSRWAKHPSREAQCQMGPNPPTLGPTLGTIQ